jgi:DNA-binding transcriptional MerR regulator
MSSSTLEDMAELLTIGELAQRTGVTTSTLRYYDELGLVRPTRSESGHRRYTLDAITTVGVVRFLQEVGFTLAEARRLLASRRRSPVAWRSLAVRKAEQLRHRIAREQAAQQVIEHALVCPEDHFLNCPNFWEGVKGFLAGEELADAHSRAHAKR